MLGFCALAAGITGRVLLAADDTSSIYTVLAHPATLDGALTASQPLALTLLSTVSGAVVARPAWMNATSALSFCTPVCYTYAASFVSDGHVLRCRSVNSANALAYRQDFPSGDWSSPSFYLSLPLQRGGDAPGGRTPIPLTGSQVVHMPLSIASQLTSDRSSDSSSPRVLQMNAGDGYIGLLDPRPLLDLTQTLRHTHSPNASANSTSNDTQVYVQLDVIPRGERALQLAVVAAALGDFSSPSAALQALYGTDVSSPSLLPPSSIILRSELERGDYRWSPPARVHPTPSTASDFNAWPAPNAFIISNMRLCDVSVMPTSTWMAEVDTGSVCLSLPTPLFKSVMAWLPTSTCVDISGTPVADMKRVYMCGMPDDAIVAASLTFDLNGASVLLPLATLNISARALLPSSRISMNTTRAWCITHDDLGSSSPVPSGTWPNAPPVHDPQLHAIRLGTYVLHALRVAMDVTRYPRLFRVGLAPRFNLSKNELVGCRAPAMCTPSDLFVPSLNTCVRRTCSPSSLLPCIPTLFTTFMAMTVGIVLVLGRIAAHVASESAIRAALAKSAACDAVAAEAESAEEERDSMGGLMPRAGSTDAGDDATSVARAVACLASLPVLMTEAVTVDDDLLQEWASECDETESLPLPEEDAGVAADGDGAIGAAAGHLDAAPTTADIDSDDDAVHARPANNAGADAHR